MKTDHENRGLEIVVLVPYFGPPPAWFRIFLDSCKRQKALRFVFFGDGWGDFRNDGNVQFVSQGVSEFFERASEVLGTSIPRHAPYKVCDFKILLGEIYSDHVADADYWGHCDIDLVFGDLSPLLSRIDDHDVVSPCGKSVGHFQLYRNCEKTRLLLRGMDYLVPILKDGRYRGVDELILTHVLLHDSRFKWLRADAEGGIPESRCIEHDGQERSASLFPDRPTVSYKYDGTRTTSESRDGGVHEHLYLHWLFWKKNFPWERLHEEYQRRGELNFGPRDYSGKAPNRFLRTLMIRFYLQTFHVLYFPRLFDVMFKYAVTTRLMLFLYPRILRSRSYRIQRRWHPRVCY